jgi:hypothetical protein
MSDTIHIHIERECPVRVITVEPTGARGAAGTSATVAVGTTTTGAAGTNASVTNSGTTSAAVFNFTIPRGDTGAAGASGGSSTAWRYRAKTNATSGYPTNGHLLWNNATQTSATEILVSHLDDEGTDIELFLSFFLEGQKIFIQNRDDSSQNQVWEISGTPTVTGANTSTAYYTFPVTLVSSAGAAFTNNHSILFGSIAAAVNAVTSATTSDGTANLDVESITGLYIDGDVFTATSGTGTAVSGISDSGVGATFYSQGNYGAIIGSAVGTALQLNLVGGDYYLECYNNFTTVESAIERVRGWFVWFYNTFTGRLKTADITADRDWTLPDESGTLALTSQLPTLGTNIATFLATPTSANLAAAVTGETGSGALVFGTSPTIDAPTISGSVAFTSTTRPTSAGTGTPAATSLMTRDDVALEPFYNLGSVFRVSATPAFANSGTGSAAITSAGDRWVALTSGTSNSGWGRAQIGRGITTVPSYSGGGINFASKLGVSIVLWLGHSAATDNLNIFRLRFGSDNTPVADGVDAVTYRGFGVEIKARGTSHDWRVYGHNGTSITYSAWSNTGLNANSLQSRICLTVMSNGAGGVTASIGINGSRTLSTISTTGGATTSGVIAQAFVECHVANSASGTLPLSAALYDAIFYAQS